MLVYDLLLLVNQSPLRTTIMQDRHQRKLASLAKRLGKIVAGGAFLLIAMQCLAVDTNSRLAVVEAEAEGGDVGAKTVLALMFEHGEGVPKDLERARLLYCDAARQGYAEAQFSIGWMYANGRGVPRSDTLAAAFFAMAAEQGHVQAANMLAYVRPEGSTQLPSCLFQERPPIAAAEEPPISTQAQTEEAIQGERSEIERLVNRIAPKYAVDPKLALAVITVESGFSTTAVSPKNAHGLMQLIPETAERFGVRKLLNPVENINGGLAYLRWLLAYFKGDVTLVVAAYNAGERAVEKYRGVPPYAETRSYVKKITNIYRKSIHPFQSGIVEPSSVLASMRRLHE